MTAQAFGLRLPGSRVHTGRVDGRVFFSHPMGGGGPVGARYRPGLQFSGRTGARPIIPRPSPRGRSTGDALQPQTDALLAFRGG